MTLNVCWNLRHPHLFTAVKIQDEKLLLATIVRVTVRITVAITAVTTKLSVEESQSREHWRGAVRVRRRPGGMFAGWGSNQWHDCQVVITGEGFVFDCDVLSRDKKKLAAVNDAMSDLSPSASSFVTLSSGPIRRRLNKQNTAAPASSLLIDERSLSWESIVRVEISPGDLTVRHKLGVLDMDVTYLSSEVRSSSRSASPVRMAERDSPSFGSDEIVNLRFVSAGDDGDTSLNKSRYAADLEVVVRVIKLLGCNVRSDSTTHCDDDDGDGFGLSSQSLSRHFAQEFLGEEVSSEDDAALSVAIPIRHRATFSNSAERSPTHGSRPGAAPRDSSSGLTSVESLLHSAARGTSRSSISGSSYSTRPSLNSSGHTVQIIGECDAHPGRPQSGSDWVGSHKIEASAKKTAAGQLDITPISISAVSARDSFSQGKVRLSEDWKRSPDNFTRRKRNSVDGSAHTDTSLSAMRRSSTCGDRGRRDERSSLSEQLHCLRGLYRDDLAQSGSGSESSSPRASHQPKHRDLRSLKQLLNALRGERDSLQQRLVEVITAREKLLEKFHFLQALRAVVDDPPRAPTRTLSSAKTPSVEKAMQMLAVYREHVDGASGSATPVSMQSGSSSSQLSEAEDFVKIMLRDGHMMDHLAFDSEGVTAQQPHTKERTESVDSVSLWQAQSTSRAISTNSSKIEQQLVYGSNLRQCDVSMSMNSTAGLFTSGSSFLSPEASSHSSSSSWRQQRGDIQSPFADALVEAARSPSTTSPLVNSSTSSLGMPFTPPSFKKPQETVSIESTSARMRPPNSTGSIRTSPWKLYSSKRPLQQKPHTASDLTALSSPTRSASAASSSAHIFGAPPAEFQSDFDEVMRQLEEVWNCELESFETVGRLAQCLVLREQTYTRLSRLKIQERAMVVPQQEVLYDVEF
eukprot:gene22619-28756_t